MKEDKDNEFWAFDPGLTTSRPNIGDVSRLHAYLDDIINRRWLTNDGPILREFEERLRDYLGVQHAMCVSNGTAGLQIAIRALDLRGEVICPSFTFIATPHSLKWLGIEPVFCDVDPTTHCLDVNKVESLITDRTTGILGVHLWGNSCYSEELEDIAARHRLSLIFDAAHRFRRSGNMSAYPHCDVYSLHATKWFNSFEGGVVTVGNSITADRIRKMRNFGFSDYHSVDYLGTNGKMSEIHAAMGLVSLGSAPGFEDVLADNYYAYYDRIANMPGLTLYDTVGGNYQYIVVEVKEHASRNRIVDVLLENGVMARKYFCPPCHLCEPYNRYGLSLPVTDHLSKSLISLPTGTAITEDDIGRVCGIISRVLEGG